MSERSVNPFDLGEFRRRLAVADRKRPWSSLEEIVDDESFARWLKAEFPAAAEVFGEAGRRSFLKLMGASLLMAGLAGCGRGRSDLALPYVTQPEQAVPGVPRYYATAVELAGYAQPVLATCHDGRPTKLDGNPQHPCTKGGGSDVYMQASLLQLYDPDRSKAPVRNGQLASWAGFERELAVLRERWSAQRGRGLRILIGATTSPTIVRQLRELRLSLPEARLHLFEPMGAPQREAAIGAAFGRETDVHLALENCEVIVSLDDDFLGPGPRQVMHAQAWASRRGEAAPGAGRVRLHVAESTPSLTGVTASTRLPVDASRLPALAAALGAQFGAAGAEPSKLLATETEWVRTAARELSDRRGHSLLICGAHLAPAVQALAPWLNQQLGNSGRTVFYTEPVAYRPGANSTLADLVRDMTAGNVETLIMLNTNPVYTAPGGIGFVEALKRVRTTFHAGLYRDETAHGCDWHLPLSHPLESWADARSIDGTAAIIQPVVAPLYSTRTIPQFFAMLAGAIDPAADAPVRTTWTETFGTEFEQKWRQSLHDGYVEGTAAPARTIEARAPDISAGNASARSDAAIDVVFRPDPCVWDGSFANVAWMQELPKPLSKITWDCPVGVSPRLADRMHLGNGDLAEITVGDRTIRGPVWITPGQAANTVVLSLGYGRQHIGQIADGIGYSAYAAMPADGAWQASGSIRRLPGSRKLVTMQMHHRMEGFDFVREVTRSSPRLPPAKTATSLYPEWQNTEHAWAMAIDLDRCIGCNACIAACNIENNVLVVGKEQVDMGREMLWLRVDHYYTGDIETPHRSFQPVPCMHCEKAPCEMGCPVHATVHSGEGINQMVYNRCIGTRTCSSYCPYKVRRFNWYDYRRFDEPTQASHNPDVTVRSRGVMEKCTYCTQRIQAAHVVADKEGRKLRDGEVVTACQQACPTTAIVFGNLKDPEAAVAKLRRSERNYVLLEELGTRPRTSYLAKWNDTIDKSKKGP